MSERIETIHLRRLVWLRYGVLAGELAAVLGARFALGAALPLAPMLALIAALFALNLWTHRRLHRPEPVRPAELAWQLGADVLQLTALLYLSGGFANPFIFMLLPPLAIAAAALTPGYIGWIAAVTVLCYSLLLVAYQPLPVLERLGFLTPTVLRQTGMWVCFVVSAAMIVVFVLRTRITLRQKERELAAAREQALRNEHLAQLGSLAAGTAHELGTPLATLAFLADELEAQAAHADQRAQLQMLREQVRRCRRAIDELARSAGELRASTGRAVSVGEWLAGAVQRWRDRHPEVTFTLDADPALGERRLLLDRALDQALASLAANAARESATVAVTARGDGDRLVLEVADRGPGVPGHLRGRAGREPLGGLADVAGLGLGLYLATSTVERLGGTLTLAPREGGGTCARIALPLERLALDPEPGHGSEHAAPAAG